MARLRKTWQVIYHVFFTLVIGWLVTIIPCQAANPLLVIKHLGDGQSLVQIGEHKKYLILPVEECSPEAKVYMLANNEVVNGMNIRLAINKIDYFVPVDLSGYEKKSLSFSFKFIPDSALCWKEMKLSDEFDLSNKEYFRPVYHFTPKYGWMNDPNGMVYKEGVYHLFYQYNPYGSMWGNMHWGHATSSDLINWADQPVAIFPDSLGAIFSGSCVVDKDNTAGFGAGAIVAFYTSAGERQVQSMAYSLDNGKTFKKYSDNPILTSTQTDFRDPKVFWHKATAKWIMILAAGQQMQIYSSSNLKDWAYESSFGEGQGAHGGVWECPDLIELSIENTALKKWVLICNINPGGLFGGSATQYFIGTFDGRNFVNDSPKLTKWLDWGKDHYAAVTWSNAPKGRHIILAWMSNWQYANNVPTKQYRSANSIARDLSLYTSDGEIYLKAAPVPEMVKIRSKTFKKKSFNVDRTCIIDPLLVDNTGTYEVEMTIQNKDAEVIGMQLLNSKGEFVELCYNPAEKKFSVDRTKSGNVFFKKEFPAITVAPVDSNNEITLCFFVDKSSLEVFGNEGRFAMTNLIFPSEPYNHICFYAKGGSYRVTSFTVYKLEVE